MINPSKRFLGVETLKAYNPSTAHRRKERDAEKKKNKAERKVTREQALLKKNPAAIKEELDKLEAMVKSGQHMTDGRSRRLQKLQQLWAQVVSAVEAERRVRTADVSSIAASDGHKGSGASGSRCLQDRLSHGERVAEEEETRYYCPELCNTGIFRHPDGSIRPYPPLVAHDKSEQRRRFVESQQRQVRRSAQKESDDSSAGGSEDEASGTAAKGSSSSSSLQKKTPADSAQTAEAAEDFLASIPLPSEPPPPETASGAPGFAVPPSGAPVVTPVPPPIPYFPLPFAGPSVSAYGTAATQQTTGAPPGVPPGPPAPYLPHAYMNPFAAIPAPPPQLLAQMHQQLPAQQPRGSRQSPQQQSMQLSPSQPQQAVSAERKRPAAPKNPQQQPPTKKQQTAPAPADTADLKAAIAFVPTHLRTKKLPATAKTQEGPSISRVSAYSMGAAALGRQGAHGSGSSADGTATSGLARFLGEANKQRTAAASGTLKSGPADLDKAFDEFLKEVGAA